MNIDLILDIPDLVRRKSLLTTQREVHLISTLCSTIQEALNMAIGGSHRENRLEFSPIQGLTSCSESIDSGIEISLNIFHRSCLLFLTSTLALEMVHRFLGKTQPVVDRILNKEELSVLALIVTLTISDLRDQGILGIYLKNIRCFEERLQLSNDDLNIEETSSHQVLTIKLEPATLEQIRERAKLLLIDNSMQERTLNTSHRVSIEIDAEVRSLSTLFALRPELKWKLGRDVPLSISIEDKFIGYGELIIGD